MAIKHHRAPILTVSRDDPTNPSCQVAAGRPRKEDEPARLENLLRTAETLFLNAGYSNVSLETIARQAHVAVRTIYVKFGGKIGLFRAVIANASLRYFGDMPDLATDDRAVVTILSDFANRFVKMTSHPSFLQLYRMVQAEAPNTPELGVAFYLAGPRQMREKLQRFFSRPDIARKLHTSLAAEALASHLVNCLLGEITWTIWFGAAPTPDTGEQSRAEVGLHLFLRSVIRGKALVPIMSILRPAPE